MGSLRKAAADLEIHGYALVELEYESRLAVTETYRLGNQFFQQPLSMKLQNTLAQDCGYRPPGVEYSQTIERPDQMESFTATAREIDISGLRTAEGRRLYHHMREVITIFETMAEELARELGCRIAPNFDSTTLIGAFREWSCLQINHSRPAETKAEMINDSHEDGHLLTIASADGPGLEIQTPTGTFQPIETGERSVIVMPGETAWLLSGGYVRPLYHQVRRHADLRDRLALIYFGEVDPSIAKPWIENELNNNLDMIERVIEHSHRFGLQGFDPDAT